MPGLGGERDRTGRPAGGVGQRGELVQWPGSAPWTRLRQPGQLAAAACRSAGGRRRRGGRRRSAVRAAGQPAQSAPIQADLDRRRPARQEARRALVAVLLPRRSHQHPAGARCGDIEMAPSPGSRRRGGSRIGPAACRSPGRRVHQLAPAQERRRGRRSGQMPSWTRPPPRRLPRPLERWAEDADGITGRRPARQRVARDFLAGQAVEKERGRPGRQALGGARGGLRTARPRRGRGRRRRRSPARSPPATLARAEACHTAQGVPRRRRSRCRG